MLVASFCWYVLTCLKLRMSLCIEPSLLTQETFLNIFFFSSSKLNTVLSDTKSCSLASNLTLSTWFNCHLIDLLQNQSYSPQTHHNHRKNKTTMCKDKQNNRRSKQHIQDSTSDKSSGSWLNCSKFMLYLLFLLCLLSIPFNWCRSNPTNHCVLILSWVLNA